MNATSARLIAVLAILCAAVTACSGTHHGGESLVTYTVTVPPSTSWAVISCPVGQQADGGSCIQCPQLKPCFNGPDEMYVMAGIIYPAIEEFSTETLGSKISHARWRVVPSGRQIMSACVPVNSSDSPMFCGDDGTIYIGEDAMWSMYNTNDRGDAINVAVMSHEWGHFVQMHRGAMSRNPSLEQMRKQETQADCVSGAVAQFMHQKGYFSDADLAGVMSFISAIPFDPYYTHGTNEQRLQAFRTGYDSGMVACNPIGIGAVITG